MYQERLFLGIPISAASNGTPKAGSLGALHQKAIELKDDHDANGWVALRHITLYFFQHPAMERIVNAQEIIDTLSSPQFIAAPFAIKLSKITPCGTRTLRLSVEDDFGGLASLHAAIVNALNVPELEEGWSGGHVSLYRFNAEESQALTTSKPPSWVKPLVEEFSSIDATIYVDQFVLYRSDRKGYTPLATFLLEG